jgi:hypothetical protein
VVGLQSGNGTTMEKVMPALRAHRLTATPNGPDSWQIRNAS